MNFNIATKQKLFFARLLLFVLPVLLFSSCNWPEENPDLVNPPLKSPTIGIRYLNLSGDMENRTLKMNSDGIIENIPFATISVQKNPPADSIFLTVEKDGNTEYAQKKPLKFLTRNVNYTVISLASIAGSKKYRDTDTLIWLTTSLISPENDTQAMIRLFNGVNDSTTTYSVRYGCPNGASIITQSRYGVVNSKFTNIQSGEIPVSVLRHKNNNTEIIGVYKIKLKPKGQYCLLVLPINGQEVVYIYDELSKDNNPLQVADLLIEKKAQIRIINFSKEEFTASTGQNEVITSNLASKNISEYNEINACESQTSDYLILSSQSVNDTLISSFEVLAKYDCLIADSENKIAAIKMLIPPNIANFQKSNEATIRVVHTAWKRNGITLSMGLRNTEEGVKTGERIAVDLQYAQISKPINVLAGIAPLTCFSSTEPAQLITATVTRFEKGKSYLIVLATSDLGYDKIYIIEEGEQSKALTPMNTGVFTQLVAATAGVSSININLSVDGESYLKDVTIPAAGIIATVLPEGKVTLNASGKEHSVIATPYNRLLLVVSGDRNQLDIFDVNTSPLYTDPKQYRRRFLNAVYTLPEISVKESSNATDFIASSKYGESSEISIVNIESRKSFRFFDKATSKEIYKTGDLSFSFYKCYTIVFTGSAPTGYSVIIVQEF